MNYSRINHQFSPIAQQISSLTSSRLSEIVSAKGPGVNKVASNVEGGGLEGGGVKWRGGEERKTTLCGGVKVERKENEKRGETMKRKREKVEGEKMTDVMEGKVRRIEGR